MSPAVLLPRLVPRALVRAAVVLTALLAGAGAAHAGGRLLATGGVTEIEGAAGGGIVPWAVIAGYGTRDEVGASAFATYLGITDFRLQSSGFAIGLHDRVELSYARQTFGLGLTVPGESIRLDVYGAKVRLFGDAVYDQDTWVPQVALGVQRKNNLDFGFVPLAIGARRGSGTDVYLAATKLFLAGAMGRNLLVDATVRATKANQLGLLGFGGDLDDRYRAVFEGSVAWFLDDRIAFGAEYRSKPNNLGAFREQAFEDVFVAWVPNKHVALTLSHAWLGRIADRPRQRGAYVSLQVAD